MHDYAFMQWDDLMCVFVCEWMHINIAEGFLASRYFQTMRTPWPKHTFCILDSQPKIFWSFAFSESREPLGWKPLPLVDESHYSEGPMVDEYQIINRAESHGWWKHKVSNKYYPMNATPSVLYRFFGLVKEWKPINLCFKNKGLVYKG